MGTGGGSDNISLIRGHVIPARGKIKEEHF